MKTTTQARAAREHEVPPWHRPTARRADGVIARRGPFPGADGDGSGVIGATGAKQRAGGARFLRGLGGLLGSAGILLSASSQALVADLDGDALPDTVELRGMSIEVTLGAAGKKTVHNYRTGNVALSLSKVAEVDGIPGSEVILLLTKSNMYDREIDVLHPAAGGMRRTYKFPSLVGLSITPYLQDTDGAPGAEIVLLMTKTYSLDRVVSVIHDRTGAVANYDFKGVTAVSVSYVEQLDAVPGNDIAILSTLKGNYDREVTLINDAKRTTVRFDYPGLSGLSLSAAVDTDGNEGKELVTLATGPWSNYTRRVETLSLASGSRHTYSFGDITSLAVQSIKDVDGAAGAELCIHWNDGGVTGEELITDRTQTRNKGCGGPNIAPPGTITIPPSQFAMAGRVRTAKGQGVSGVTVAFDNSSGIGPVPDPVQTDAQGSFRQQGFSSGTVYVANPSWQGQGAWWFSPARKVFSLTDWRKGASLDFVASPKKVGAGLASVVGDGEAPEDGAQGVDAKAMREWLTLGWEGDGEAVNVVESAPSLIGPWSRVEAVFNSAGGRTEALIRIGAEPFRFFRVRPAADDGPEEDAVLVDLE